MSGKRFGASVVNRVCAPFAMVLILAAPAAAQRQKPVSAQSVSTIDIQRLQDELQQTSADLSRLRDTNPGLAGRLRSDLDDLGEEVIYLKVKLRREGNVTRSEYTDVDARLRDLRSRARGDSTRAPYGNERGTTGSSTSRPPYSDPRPSSSEPDRPRAQGDGVIPSGQEIDVRLQSQLSSDTAQVEDRFEATTVVDLFSGNRVLIPAGSVVRGIVRSVDKASRTDRKGSMTVSFDQVVIGTRTYPMRGTVIEAIESEGMRGETARIGTGAGVGAIIGGILGGVKGALLGVLIGGGGTIAATEGKDVTLPPGTILRVRLDTPPAIR
jgi:hypothetical protein